MSKLMLTRASTVVLKNRRRYSLRTRHGRTPRRQSAPTVLQRTGPPGSPRGYHPQHPPHSPCSPRGRGYPLPPPASSSHSSQPPPLSPSLRGSEVGCSGVQACRGCGGHHHHHYHHNHHHHHPQQHPDHLYPCPSPHHHLHAVPPPSSPRSPRDRNAGGDPVPLSTGTTVPKDHHTLRRGSVQPHHLTGGSTRSGREEEGDDDDDDDDGRGGVGGNRGLFPRAWSTLAGGPTACSGAAGHNSGCSSHTTTTLASANAALREVSLQEPKLRRITFQEWRRRQEKEEEEEEQEEKERKQQQQQQHHQQQQQPPPSSPPPPLCSPQTSATAKRASERERDRERLYHQGRTTALSSSSPTCARSERMTSRCCGASGGGVYGGCGCGGDERGTSAPGEYPSLLSPPPPLLLPLPTRCSFRQSSSPVTPLCLCEGGTGGTAAGGRCLYVSGHDYMMGDRDCCPYRLPSTPPPADKFLYDSAVVWADADDGEQTYSVLNSLCEAGAENSNPCEFVARAFIILSGTWPVTVFLVGLLALPLVMTSIGVNYLHECPVEPKLPIYLVVGGCFGMVKLLFLLWKQMRRHKGEMGDLHDDLDLLTMTRMSNMALNVFLLVWFAFGHYWLVRIWKPHFAAPLHEPRNWCDRTVFVFCFWQLVICHGVLALLLLTSALMVCCFACLKCVVAEDAKR